MYELLRRSVERAPDAVGVMRGGDATSYSELLRRADVAAGRLTDRGVTRFALVDDDPTVVIALLAAASATGVEACVYPPTASSELVAELREAFGHHTIFSRRTELGLPSPDELFEGSPGDIVIPASRPLLCLTTGTTGRPKAAHHEWDRLLARLAKVPPAADQRWLLAYGMNQFGGIQVLMHVLSVGAGLVATDVFSPRSGLESMREWGVTHASATPTYWRFVLTELAADGGAVPQLQQVTLGGEATDQRLLDRLAATFPDARITQIYGANEFGNLRGINDGKVGLPVDCLQQDGQLELKVIDGELWVRSPGGMLGYLGEDPLDEGWRPTGDLVEIVSDRVLFRGRRSSVVNVGGVKVHPLPVEERVNGVAGVQLAHVYGRPNALTGAVMAVEVITVAGADHDEVEEAIRNACSDLPPAARPRSIRFVDTISTEGNKVSRR